jgi:pilus assembly protein CpaE
MTASTKILPTRRKRIALFSADTNLRNDVSTRLESLAIYDVQVHEPELFLEGPKGDQKPSVVIFDVGEGGLLGSPKLNDARAAWAGVPLIALSGDLPDDRIRTLVRLNAADWLRKPFDNKELINAVSFHDSGTAAAKSRVITFISASGGAGATTLALAASEYLAKKSSDAAAATCLVDLDFQHANCSSYLNLYNEFDLTGVITQPERLDVELMDIIKLMRAPGFTLYSFERPELPFEPKGQDFVFKLLDLAAYRFDNVVIDLPNRETPWSNTVLSTSDEIFLVFELNIVSLRHAKQIYSRIRELRGSAASVTLVANKHKRKLFGNHFSRSELQKIFKMPHIKSVSLDAPLLTDAVNRALLPSEVHSRARFNKDVKALLRERLDAKPR